MGIAGSIVDPNFFSDYLGMRNEFVDTSEMSRRIEKDIFDKEEYKKAYKWILENCKEGPDYNDDDHKWSREKLEADWEYVTKMTLIARDLMIGNSKLKEIGYGEEALGHKKLL